MKPQHVNNCQVRYHTTITFSDITGMICMSCQTNLGYNVAGRFDSTAHGTTWNIKNNQEPCVTSTSTSMEFVEAECSRADILLHAFWWGFVANSITGYMF